MIIKTLLLFTGVFAVGLFCASPAMADQRVFYNPLASDGTLVSGDYLPVSELIGRLIYAFLAVGGVIATMNIIRAGIKIGTSQGNAEQMEQGKKGLTFAIIGLIVAFLGFIVVNQIIVSLAPQVQTSTDFDTRSGFGLGIGAGTGGTGSGGTGTGGSGTGGS